MRNAMGQRVRAFLFAAVSCELLQASFLDCINLLTCNA